MDRVAIRLLPVGGQRRKERRDFVAVEDALFVGQEDWINNLYKATRPRDDLLMLPRDVLEYVQGTQVLYRSAGGTGHRNVPEKMPC